MQNGIYNYNLFQQSIVPMKKYRKICTNPIGLCNFNPSSLVAFNKSAFTKYYIYKTK